MKPITGSLHVVKNNFLSQSGGEREIDVSLRAVKITTRLPKNLLLASSA
jgi:hypothetical protein